MEKTLHVSIANVPFKASDKALSLVSTTVCLQASINQVLPHTDDRQERETLCQGKIGRTCGDVHQIELV